MGIGSGGGDFGWDTYFFLPSMWAMGPFGGSSLFGSVVRWFVTYFGGIVGGLVGGTGPPEDGLALVKVFPA